MCLVRVAGRVVISSQVDVDAWVKKLVAAKLAKRCEIQIAYAIGVPEPVSVMVNTHRTGRISDDELRKAVLRTFNLTPHAILEHLKLRRPIYKETAAYGHFGREEEGFTWEEIDMINELRREARRA